MYHCGVSRRDAIEAGICCSQVTGKPSLGLIPKTHKMKQGAVDWREKIGQNASLGAGLGHRERQTWAKGSGTTF